jgi:pimeloyl-ACP methyl ester carboxylesterase
MRVSIIVVLLVLALGCAGQAPPPEPTPKPVETGPGAVAAGDGIEIAYTVSGSGSPALVLVHGWMCDQTYWLNQVDDLAADYTVVTVDLPGHGLSGTAREAWTVTGFGGDVAKVVDHLGLDRVILIGHSMGGPVALEAARLLPGRTVGVIGVDTFQDAESEWDPDQKAAMLAAAEADFGAFCTRFVTGMFAEGADPDLVTVVTDDMCSGPSEVGLALMRSFSDYDLAAAMAAAGVPIRAVNAPLWPTDVEANRRHADFDAVVMEDVGHFLMQEEPQAFNRELRTVIAELAGNV